MRTMLAMSVAVIAGFAAWATAAGAEPLPETAPDALLSAATLSVTASLRQDESLLTNSQQRSAELVEATILPLFNIRHMTQRAMAHNWRLASPEQQSALIAEFKTLLVKTFSTALTNPRDWAIEYKPLRMAPGETEVTVRSSVKQPATQQMTIDYDMEQTPAGWKVYDIKIAGISLITTYRSTFTQIVRDDGVEGLVQSLAAKNRQADTGLKSEENGALPFILMHAVIPGILRGGR